MASYQAGGQAARGLPQPRRSSVDRGAHVGLVVSQQLPCATVPGGQRACHGRLRTDETGGSHRAACGR